MKNTKTYNSGFTTIELLFALAIYSILFMATSSLIMTTVMTSQTSKEDFEASLLAQKHYEKTKASTDILEVHEEYEYGDFIVSIDTFDVPEYKGQLFKIIVKVSKGDQILDILTGLKIIKKTGARL